MKKKKKKKSDVSKWQKKISDVVVINKIHNFIKKKNHVTVKLFKKNILTLKKKRHVVVKLFKEKHTI